MNHMGCLCVSVTVIWAFGHVPGGDWHLTRQICNLCVLHNYFVLLEPDWYDWIYCAHEHDLFSWWMWKSISSFFFVLPALEQPAIDMFCMYFSGVIGPYFVQVQLITCWELLHNVLISKIKYYCRIKFQLFSW